MRYDRGETRGATYGSEAKGKDLLHAVIGMFVLGLGSIGASETANTDREDLIRVGIERLLSMQEEDGAWPYEGVYRVRGEIPIGYRVGGTALVCQAILYGATREDSNATRAMERGIELILKELKDDLMAARKDYRYDVRVWGQACALELFCRLLKTNRATEFEADIKASVMKLTAALLEEEIEGGGWNYAGRRRHASFVTAPVVQALLFARAAGAVVPDEVLNRSRQVLQASRVPNGAFKYSGIVKGDAEKDSRAKVPGAIGRSPLCETTLLLLGEGDGNAIKNALDAFHEHWDELENRRKKIGTHKPPYGIAPYYFYFAHRYAAQAISTLPTAARSAEQKRLLEKLLRTRDADGTWNDRVFARSRNYGTAMVVIALMGDGFPLPPSNERVTVP